MAVIQQMLASYAAAAATTQKWNSADKSADLTLSGSDLVVTRGAAASAYRTVRAVTACSGKKYWETVFTAAGGFTPPFGMHGVAASSTSVSSGVGTVANSWSFQSRDGDKYAAGTQTVLGYTPIAVGDTLMVAHDTATGGIWFGRNGTWYAGSPATGTSPTMTTSGTVYPATSLYSNGTSHTTNFGGSAFTYTPPTGFTGF